jgi:hypothetical protein
MSEAKKQGKARRAVSGENSRRDPLCRHSNRRGLTFAVANKATDAALQSGVNYLLDFPETNTYKA